MREYQDPGFMKIKITYLPILTSGVFHQFWSSVVGYCVFLSRFLVAVGGKRLVGTELGRKWKTIAFIFEKKVAKTVVSFVSTERESGARAS